MEGREAPRPSHIPLGVKAMPLHPLSTIEEMWWNARFVRHTAAGLREGAPHDVVTL